MVVRNRRAAAWPFETNRWTAGKASRQVEATVRAWGYPYPVGESLEEAVRLLVAEAVRDDGKRISVHLADQDRRLLVAVLSHNGAEPDDRILAQLSSVEGVVSCGTESCDAWRRVFAVLSTERPHPAPQPPDLTARATTPAGATRPERP
ncbi:hypothetical protein ACIRQY_32205 [Streptomyces sp. NPDC101490]|uniref:hypothetical protein n=1 Tax=Streptomyces sp. NPDC101490 TaxID=3366143 RepID=UPI003828F202